MSVTFAANYKEVFATETVEKIEELVEDNYDLGDILEFVDQYSEADFISYYEEYVSSGENIGYDVVDAFVKYHGGMCYVENVEDAYRGCYDDEESFAEEYYTEIYGEVPAFLVVDWEATWNSSLRYDFDFVEGHMFLSNF
jgi:antirestriction protein